MRTPFIELQIWGTTWELEFEKSTKFQLVNEEVPRGWLILLIFLIKFYYVNQTEEEIVPALKRNRVCLRINRHEFHYIVKGVSTDLRLVCNGINKGRKSHFKVQAKISRIITKG